jgi:hypothetical protein
MRVRRLGHREGLRPSCSAGFSPKLDEAVPPLIPAGEAKAPESISAPVHPVERLLALCVICTGGQLRWRVRVPARKSKVPSDGVMVDVFLGVTITSQYTLVRLGIMPVFLRG